MDLVLKIVFIVGPLLLGTYLSTKENIKRKTKIVVWVVCALISFLGVYAIIGESQKEKKEEKESDYYHDLIEKGELDRLGYPQEYVNGLGESPLLKHFLKRGRQFEKESHFEQAIEEFKKCLGHPKATASNKVAANVLIGNCYYDLSKYRVAEEHYKVALEVSGEVDDKSERLRGLSAAYGNIGLIYRLKGEPAEALQYLNEALEIDRWIGYEQGIASDLGNIGLIYRDMGKLDEALKYYKESLDIFKRIGAQPKAEIVSKRIENIQRKDHFLPGSFFFFYQSLPSMTKNLFGKRFLDFQKLLIKGSFTFNKIQV